jgi:hypothetical protein
MLALLLLPRLRRRRRLAALVPLAAAVAALLSLGGGADLSALAAPGGIALGRPAGGLVLVCALAATVCLVIGPPPDAGEIVAMASAGALSAVALAAGSPLLWALCLVGAMTLLGVRWVAGAPARATLAAARVGTLGAAALVAAAPFLPVDAAAVPPRAHVVGGLLSGGAAALLGLLPLGGWITGGNRLLRGPALAPWALLVMPALVTTVQTLQQVLPSDARSTVGAILLPAGGLSAGWAALRGLSAPARDQYPRVLLADLALVAMGLATPEAGARVGTLLLVLTHLCLGPLLLQDPSRSLARPRRFAWLALSGIPPTPAFWGRFALIGALTAGFGGTPLVITLPVAGALIVVAFRAAGAASAAGDESPAGPAGRLAAWIVPLAALTVGLVPEATLRALFGVG